MKLTRHRVKQTRLSLVQSAHARQIEANRRHTQGVIDFLKSLPPKPVKMVPFVFSDK